MPGWARRCCGKRNLPEAQREFLITLKLNPSLGPAYYDLAFAAKTIRITRS